MPNFGAEKPPEDTSVVEEMKEEMKMPNVSESPEGPLRILKEDAGEIEKNMQETDAEKKLERLKMWKENPKALSEEGYESFQEYGLRTREMWNPEKMALVVAADMFKEENPELAERINNKIREEELKEKNRQAEEKDAIKESLKGKSELTEDDVRRIKNVSIGVHDAFADPVLAEIQHKAWEWENNHRDVKFESKADTKKENMEKLLVEIGY